MARQERQQPEREYAPGVTDPEAFACLVTSHPFYESKRHKTLDGRVEIELRLIQVRSYAKINHIAGDTVFDPLQDIENRTEAAVLEELRLRG